MKVLIRFLHYFKPYWKKELVAFFVIVLASLISAPALLIYRKILDDILPDKNLLLLIYFVLLVTDVPPAFLG